ncbi:hypothetical protein RZS08_61030, partial [Arthrospira platensis SPKY1]|nr:hypothetical protein [Arthrospira platensis SPKY1]
VAAGKAVDVGQHGGQVGEGDTEPAGQGGGVFVDRGGGDKRAAAGVFGAVEGGGGELAVDAVALHGAAHDEVVPAPAVVGAAAVVLQRTPEVRGGEGGDLVGHAQ